MQKIFVLILLTLTSVFGCKQKAPELTKQQKAERLVKSYLDSTLNDRKSYEPVKFDSIEPVFGKYRKYSPEGKKLQSEYETTFGKYIKYVNESSEEMLKANPDIDEYDRLSKLGNFYKEKVDSLDLIIDNKSKGFRGPIIGYTIEHKYRAKNAFGATMLEKARFEVDGTVTHIKKAKDIKL